MQTAAIITVGNELLTGDKADTNSLWLSAKLLELGINVNSKTTVADDIDDIGQAIKYATDSSDLVIITGGLGPTDDDITRNGVAKFTNTELIFHKDIYQRIKDRFKSRNREMSTANEVQAWFPVSSEILGNDFGTADAFYIEHKGKLIFALPGVPSEMKHIFNDRIFNILKEKTTGLQTVIKKLKLYGIGESTLAEKLGDLMSRDRHPLINCTVHCDVITLHIIAKHTEKSQAQQLAQKDIEKLEQMLEKCVFGYDQQELPDVIGRLLTENDKTLSTAESCTGGLIAKMVTDISGSSGYFKQGWITYSNQAKIDRLGVDPGIIEKFGAVSSEVAKQMALGAQKNAHTDYAIATTGIAGPSGGTEEKPVGLVYIALATPDGCKVKKCNFSRTRDFIRLCTAQYSLNMLRLKLQFDEV